jgi:hypothetical protein|tara:strand:- start:108 stop:1148 length:1041 start_codon:yes stop_codon:yes gene_type:complete
MVKNSISCVILTNGLNNKFLTERTLSSIIKTTDNTGWDVELILVDNSPEQNVEKILKEQNYLPVVTKRIKVIESLPNHLPKAFNLGVKKSNSKYTALFHDDCEILDSQWINKLTSNLTEEVYMVGVEIHTDIKPFKIIKTKEYLKEVPVVFEKVKFLELGGYDETYYWGFEDVLLCAKILNKGKHIKHIPINHLHFNGMSTILLQKKVLKDKSKFIEAQNKFVQMTNKKEFNQFKKKEMGYVKVNINNITKNPLIRTLLLLFSLWKTLETTRNIGVNLGYTQLCKYWKTKLTEIPTEVIIGLMPKTQEEIDILMDDVKQQKDGELYGRLEKYKGKIFRDYFNTIKR